MADIEKHEDARSEDVQQALKKQALDTTHTDEAMKVLANYDGETTWTPEEEKKLVRRIDRKLLSLLVCTYGLQYYDKAMLSQAALFGLREDLELNVGTRYSFSSAIFYLGFIVGAYPAILMAQRYPIERVASGIVFVWGVCLMCTAACTNWQGLFAQRFFLGFLESGISPMFMLVVGGWYEKKEQALRMGLGILSFSLDWLTAAGHGTVRPDMSRWSHL
jgi:MFS family permease